MYKVILGKRIRLQVTKLTTNNHMDKKTTSRIK